MAGAEPGITLVNQPAFEKLLNDYDVFDLSEAEIDIKHEGKTLAYTATINKKPFVPEKPDWDSTEPA